MPPKKKEFKKPVKVGALPVKVDAPVKAESITSQFKFTPKKVTETGVSASSLLQSRVPKKATASYTPAVEKLLREQPLSLSRYQTASTGTSSTASAAVAKDTDFSRFLRDMRGGIAALTGDELTTGEKVKAAGMAPVKAVVGLGAGTRDFLTLQVPKAAAIGIKMAADNIAKNTDLETGEGWSEYMTKLNPLFGVSDWAADKVFSTKTAQKFAGKTSEVATALIQTINETQKARLGELGIDETTSIINPEKFGYGVSSGLSSIAFYMGVTALTKSPVLASASLGWVEGSETYLKARETYIEQGMNQDKAESKAAALALIESGGIALLEKVGMDALFRSYAGGKMRNAAISAITETLQESTQTVWSNLVTKYGYDKTQSLYADLFDTVITTLPVGFLGGAMRGGTDVEANIDTDLPKPPEIEPEDVKQAAGEVTDAVLAEARKFAEMVENPQKVDEVTNALNEDIKEAVDTKGKDVVIEQLANDETLGYTEEEAAAAVEGAITSQVPPDIMTDIKAALERVRAPKATEPQVITEPQGTEGVFENIPEDMLQEAEEAWDDTYGQSYAELEQQVQEINTQLKTAQADEKKALEAQKEELVKQQIEQEQTFIREQQEKVQAKTKEKIKKAVDEVQKSLEPKPKEDTVDRATLPKSLQNDLDRYEKLDKSTEDINTDDLLRRINASLNSRDMEFVWEGEYPNRTIVVRQKQSRFSPLGKDVRITGESTTGTVTEYFLPTGGVKGRDELVNIKMPNGGTRVNVPASRIEPIAKTEESGTVEGNEKLPDRDTREPIRQAGDTTRDRDGGEQSTERGSADQVDRGDVARREDRVGDTSARERSERDVEAEISSYFIGSAVIGDAFKNEYNKRVHLKLFFDGQWQNAIATMLPMEPTDEDIKIYNEYVNASDEVKNRIFNQLLEYYGRKDALETATPFETKPEVDLGTEKVVYTDAGVVSTTRTTPIAEKQNTKIGKVIVDIIKSKEQDLRDESLFLTAQAEGFMPLTIERLPTNELAVSHTFTQNGDLMRDPEVVFLIDKDGQLQAQTIENPPMVLNGIELIGPRPISPRDSFLNLWADNIRSQGFVPKAKKPVKVDPGKVNREQIKKLEADMRAIYLGVGDSDIEGFAKADEVMSQIITELEIAEPGDRIISPDGVISYPSTFPAWIPENARNRDDLNALINMFRDVRGLSYPSKTVETKRREFADAFFDEMDAALKVNTKPLREQILKLYDIDNIITAGQEVSEAGQNSAPRDQEGTTPERTSEGYSNEEIENVIKDYTYLTATNRVELTNDRVPTKQQLRVVNAWQPAGGREAEGAEGRGLLDEYYTPGEVVEMVRTMLDRAGAFDQYPLTVLEPSVGIGNFLYAVPEGSKITAYEINETSARLAKLNHPTANVVVQPFEELFVDKRGNKKEIDYQYEIVVGNPPYGSHRGVYKGLGEEAKIARYETYFMKRSLDLTVEGGYMAMVVPSSFLRSSMKEPGKEQMAALGELVEAIRLPNGTFATTDIGTDILVFRKSSTKELTTIDNRVRRMSGDAYFLDQANAGRILGEKTQKTGRFGVEDAVKGNLESAQKAFEAVYEPEAPIRDAEIVDAPTVTTDDVLTASPEKLEKIASEPSPVQEVAQREQARRIEQKAATDLPAQEEMLKKLDLKTGDKVQRFHQGQTQTGTLTKEDGSSVVQVETESGELVPVDENWYKQNEVAPLTSSDTLDLATLSPESVKDGQWEYVSATGELEGNFDPKRAFYMGGKYYNAFNYAQGDIYAKLAMLEKDKKTIGAEQYETQKTMLEAVLPPRMTVDRMRIPPHAHFTEEVKFDVDVAGEKVKKSLQSMFIEWIGKLPVGAFGESSRRSVQQYVFGEAVRGGDKLQNEEDRRTRRIEGDKLFKVFLTEELSAAQKKVVEDEYNRRFNSYSKPDYSLVPLVSKISATYKGDKLDLREIQRQGIGFLLNKGVGLLAHDVGLGKTMQGIIANIELINRGWAKRPLVVLPSASVYAQWVKDFRALKPDIKINELSNLGRDFKGDLATLSIPDGTISVITEEGFKKLGFSDATYKELTKDMLDVIENPNDGKKTKRAKELKTAKAEETIGKAMKGTSTERTFEDLGFDAITVDEIHNYNHIIGSAKAADDKATEYRGFSQQPSISGLKLWLASQFIMQKNNGRNVIGLSATPFTNHPLEYYSILSLFARKRMQQMGIRNVNDFMAMYMRVTAKKEVTADGQIAPKLAVRGFNNARQFQQLLREFIDFRDGEEAGIKRPNRQSRTFVVKENRLSYDYKQMAQPLFEIKEGGTLMAMTELQQIAFSPYASQFHTGPIPTPKQFVEGSPKVKLATDLLAETYFNVPNSNHIVYSHTGKDFLPMIKEYLVKEKGIPADQIQIITGDTAKPKRTTIQNDFNAGKVRIIIGNVAIEEGINLQERTTDMYLLSQPWNFTAVRQVIGRAWRQGNKWNDVRINQFFTENTFDIYMSQALEKKRVRYEQSLKQGEDYVDSGDVDYDEMKFVLMTDPVLRTRLMFSEKRQLMEQEIKRIKSDFATRNRRAKEYVDAIAKVNEYKSYIVKYPDANWAKSNLRDAEEKLVRVKQNLTERGIDVASLDKDLLAMEAMIADLELNLKNFATDEEEAVKKAKIEAETQVDTSGTEDYAARKNERKDDDKALFDYQPQFLLRLDQNEEVYTAAEVVSYVDKIDREIENNDFVAEEYRGILPYTKEKIEKYPTWRLAVLNINDVLKNDADARNYVEAGEQRYAGERDFFNLDNPIVVANGEVLDGFNRLLTLTQNGESTVTAYVPTEQVLMSRRWEQPRDLDGRYMTLQERRAKARSLGFVADTDLKRVKAATKKETDDMTDAEKKQLRADKVYAIRMRAGSYEEAKAQLERYMRRFGIQFDVDLADRIFVQGSKIRDKILAETQAYAVYYNRAITLTPEMLKTTADHEFIHLVIDNIAKIKAFEGFTRESLYVAANGGKSIAGYTDGQRRALEEKIAVGFERYLIEKALDRQAREKKYGKTLADFYEKLKNMVVDLVRNLGGSFGELADFYDTVARGQVKNEKTVVLMQNPVRKAQVAYQTDEGLSYLDFEEIMTSKKDLDNAARAAYFSEVLEVENDEIMTNKVFQNKNKLNFVKKDLNTLEDITAQARDIYLKDPEQFEQARNIELIGEAHDADKHQLDNTFADLLKPYMDLKPEQRTRVNETLWKGDEEGKRFDQGTLIRMSLSAEQITAYNAVRDALDAAHETLLTEMARKGIDEAELDTFRQEREGYMPHRWIPKMTTGQKLKSFVTGKDVFVVKHQRKSSEGGWETYHMDAFASEKEAEEAQIKFREETPKEFLTEETPARWVVDKLSSLEVDFFSSQELTSERMIAVIEQMREKKFVKDEIVELLKNNVMNMFKEKGFGRHYLRRSGVRGYDTDNTELVIADYFSGFAGYVTKLRWSTEYFVALSQVDARRQQRYYAWLRDLIAYKLNNNPEWRIARTIAFTWYLANDLSYLLTNMTQNVIVGLGELSKYVEGTDKAWKPEAYMIKAVKDWATKNITAKEASAISGLLEKGQLGAEMTVELMGFKNNPLYREISSTFSKVMYGSTAIVEREVNRIPAFLAARRIFREQGFSETTANAKALEVSNDIHFRYGRIDRPRLFRGRVNVLFIFQNYIRTFLYQLYRDASRREFIALTRKMGYTFALGGASALPFAGLFWSILKGIGDDEDDEELKKELSTWDILIQRGIPATWDIDLSTRVGIELLSVTKIADNPTDVRTYLGSLGDLLFKRPVEVMDLIGQQRYMDAWAKALPDVLANPIRAYNGYTYGVRSINGVPLLDLDGEVYKYSTWEAIIKATGFTPTQEAILWDEKAKEWKRDEEQQEKRTEISRTIRGMVQRGEFEEARQLQDDAKEAGIIAEKTDYIRTFAKDEWFQEAVTTWESGNKTREELDAIEEELIEKVYGGVATDPQRNNVRKELAIYRQFGLKNENVNDIMKAATNADKVKILLEIKDNIGQEAFDDFIQNGRTGIYTEAGNRVPILFSDDLMKLLREEEKKYDNQN